MEILNGKSTAKQIRQEITNKLSILKKKFRAPTLHSILIGKQHIQSYIYQK